MTHETEMKVKEEMYARCKERAVAILTGIVGHSVENSRDGIVLALEHAFRHKSAEESANAVMAAVMWLWACLETEEIAEVAKVAEMFKAEMFKAETFKAGTPTKA